MKQKLKSISLLLLLAVVLCSSLYSATYYDNGSQRFTITAGPILPFTQTNFSSGETNTIWNGGVPGVNPPVGGFGSLTYQMFLNPYVAIGGEIGYAFNFLRGDALFTHVPMQFKLTYIPLQGRFEIPLSLGVGIDYMSVSDASAHLALFTSFETGIDWYFTDNWGVGLKTGIWVIPELSFESSKKNQNELLTVVPITLSVTYRS